MVPRGPIGCWMEVHTHANMEDKRADMYALQDAFA